MVSNFLGGFFLATTGSEKEKMARIVQASDYVMTRCIAASDDALRALLSLDSPYCSASFSYDKVAEE
jgi:hypothetical protein